MAHGYGWVQRELGCDRDNLQVFIRGLGCLEVVISAALAYKLVCLTAALCMGR
jgi:hypothetical protein